MILGNVYKAFNFSISMRVSNQYLSICNHCKAWCCTLVRPLVTKQEKNAIIAAGYSNFFIKYENDVYSIKPNEKGICPYLKDDYSCDIHHLKPKLCKIWPVIPRYKNGKRDYIVIKCPIFPELSKDDLKQAKNEAEAIPTPIVKYLWAISSEVRHKYKRFEYENI